MQSVTVACVLRSGGEYTRAHVAALKQQIEKHLQIPHRFVCLSDVDVPCDWIALKYRWPKWWAKLELFRPDVAGDLLYVDLDTAIVRNIDHFASGAVTLKLLSDFYHPKNSASGLMFLPQGDRAAVWNAWMQDPAGHMARCAGFDTDGVGGDGKFLAPLLGPRAERWQDLFPGQIVSYKVHVRKKSHPRESGDGSLPPGARIVCFHGRPRPWDAGVSLNTSTRVARATKPERVPA